MVVGHNDGLSKTRRWNLGFPLLRPGVPQHCSPHSLS
jgi:hypothetical protein